MRSRGIFAPNGCGAVGECEDPSTAQPAAASLRMTRFLSPGEIIMRNDYRHLPYTARRGGEKIL